MKEVIALKIGRRRYCVKQRRMPDLYGKIHTDRREVVLDEDLPGIDFVDTLLHEAMHDIWQRSLSDRAHEERAINTLATGLAYLFLDNPGLLPHLEQRLREAR